MPIHFTPDEMTQRRERAAAAIRDAGLDGLLCFKQESMYWLTGYDSFGFSLFQCLVASADGRSVLLTRRPGLREARARAEGAGDVRVVIGGIIPRQDREALQEAGVALIFEPGSNIAAAAADMLSLLEGEHK